MYPDKKTVATPEITEMIKTVPLNDAGMLSNEEYFTYVRNKMISENKSDLDENTKTLLAIAKLSPGMFKDKMLYWQLEKSIKEASSTEERNKLTSDYIAGFNNKRYTLIINNKKRILESLTKGNPAPVFTTVDMNNNPVTLNDLKGKYIAIDTWATWCAPCKLQSPYFEKTAIKYKDQNIQFIAISVDENFGNWLVSAKEKSKSVLQLHASDIDKFYTDYNVEGIPKFILIDPKGNMVNSHMPYADQPAFEETIRTALNLPEEK
jgi:thiol-disulfide isomerase/thioredoxin